MQAIIVGPDSIVVRSQNQIYSELDGETVLMSLEQRRYYGANDVGTHIWHLLKRPVSVRELCRQLIEAYNVPYYQCKEDTLAYLNQLAEACLIEVKVE